MLNFSKTKIISVFLVSILAIIYALPNLISSNSKISEILPKNKLALGLDLQGGSQLMLEVDFEYYFKERLNNLKNEVQNYLRENSVRALVRQKNDKLEVVIFDKKQSIKALNLIKETTKDIDISDDFSGYELSFSAKKLAQINKNLIQQSIEVIRRRVDEGGTKEPIIQSQGKNRILLQVPGVQNSQELKSLLGQTAKMTFHFVDDNSLSTGYSANLNSQKLFDDEGNAYYIIKEVILNGDLLTDANTTFHEGKPAVAFRFNSLGTRKFAEITKDNIGRIFAIVLDNKVVTAPRINTIINQGSGVISGNFTAQEANEVALLLRAGALPAPLQILEERTVGPSLGSDSIKSGSLAVIAGVLIVAVFMIIFYGIFGFIANIAMIINTCFILSVLSILGATLTLPGIAGIVLTMGIAVDANILIFERIKEELRAKRSMFASLDQGFSQAFRTIIDSNITTLIVAFFLFALGSGPIKGFAVTLSIGILGSMFTATILTRMLIILWLRLSKKHKVNLI